MQVKEIKKIVAEKASKENNDIQLYYEDINYIVNMPAAARKEILGIEDYNTMEMSIKLARIVDNTEELKKCLQISLDRESEEERTSLLGGVVMFLTDKGSVDYNYAIEKIKEVNSKSKKVKRK